MHHVIIMLTSCYNNCSFDKENLVTLVMFANVAFGLIAKGTANIIIVWLIHYMPHPLGSNTLLSFTKFPFWIRFAINGCFMTIGK